MALATAAAIASIVGTGAGIYSSLSANNRQGQQQQQIATDNLAQTDALRDYMRILNTLGLQRSTAGSTDSEGNELYFDPATNTWKTKLGERPAEVQRASSDASVSRNTTDARQAQALNEEAIRRAHAATPGADEARRSVENFRPDSAGDITNLLVRNIVNSTNDTNAPMMQALLRNSARTGSAADSQVEAASRANADAVRRSIIDATIQGRQSVGQINQSNLAPLVNKYAALQPGTDPKLQYAQLDSQDPNKVMASLVADRAKSAATAPYAGMVGLAQGQYTRNAAATTAAGAVPSSNTDGAMITSVGGQLTNLFKDPLVSKAADKWFGSSSTPASSTRSPTNIDPYTVGSLY